MPKLTLYNTLTRTKEPFEPIDAENVRMYVCGPTVYDYAHIGNARPVIVFDVLFRMLRHIYGEDKVTYVRNITDVDDKINARALETHGDAIAAGTMSLNEAIREVTEKTAAQYQSDMKALGCLEPTHQPRATEFVLPREDKKSDMNTMIQTLLDKGHAYVAKGSQGREVLFRVNSMEDYGKLSNRKLEDQQAGARVAVEDHKENAGDFVLWKESNANEPGWDGVFDGETIHGRPGWHIECSAMSEAYLGETFDIHGGGLDLIFPHHENEIAQSRCCHGTDKMANIWMHNGFLQVEGKKMSKSDGNFHTVHDVLETNKVGGRKWSGEVVRLAMLMTHYREPIDFTVRRLEEAEHKLEKLVKYAHGQTVRPINREHFDHLISKISDDLNVNEMLSEIESTISSKAPESFRWTVAEILDFLGFRASEDAFTAANKGIESVLNALANRTTGNIQSIVDSAIQRPVLSGEVRARPHAELIASILAIRDWANKHIPSLPEHHDVFGGLLAEYKQKLTVSESAVDTDLELNLNQRLAFIANKNWAEADRIRDELLEQGIQLKDGKDPETGERITTWEVKR